MMLRGRRLKAASVGTKRVARTDAAAAPAAAAAGWAVDWDARRWWSMPERRREREAVWKPERKRGVRMRYTAEPSGVKSEGNRAERGGRETGGWAEGRVRGARGEGEGREGQENEGGLRTGEQRDEHVPHRHLRRAHAGQR